MLLGMPRSARCVQRFDDSLNSAIHITYRISLRSSSMREPRDPLLKVVLLLLQVMRPKYILWLLLGVCKSDIELRNQTEALNIQEQQSKPTEAERYLRSTICAQVDGDKVRRACTILQRASNNPSTASIMILPQVHLRKPCYDFYFL